MLHPICERQGQGSPKEDLGLLVERKPFFQKEILVDVVKVSFNLIFFMTSCLSLTWVHVGFPALASYDPRSSCIQMALANSTGLGSPAEVPRWGFAEGAGKACGIFLSAVHGETVIPSKWSLKYEGGGMFSHLLLRLDSSVIHVCRYHKLWLQTFGSFTAAWMALVLHKASQIPEQESFKFGFCLMFVDFSASYTQFFG